jgi:hypothetical protein
MTLELTLLFDDAQPKSPFDDAAVLTNPIAPCVQQKK